MPAMGKVAYKPLKAYPPEEEKNQALFALETSECSDEDESPCNGDLNVDGCHRDSLDRPFKISKFLPEDELTQESWDLSSLRSFLYFSAIILFLIFVVQLADRDEQLSSRVPKSIVNPNSEALRTRDGIHWPKDEANLSLPAESPSDYEDTPVSGRPFYKSYSTSVFDRHSPLNSNLNTSSDDLQVETDSLCPDHRQDTRFKQWWSIGERNGSDYVTVTNYIRPSKSFYQDLTVTLTTQATVEFLYHTLELCKRWDGPISVAVFTPGPELRIATSIIRFMRHCLPDPLSACIRSKVSWHFVYNREHGPGPDELCYPEFYLDVNNFRPFVKHNRCPKFAGPDSSDLIKQFEAELRKKNNLSDHNYRRKFQLTYPINVLRNTARLAATTTYLMASDIELYPSVNLVSSFSNYMSTHNVTQEHAHVKKFVFTLPIFEVEADTNVPRTKAELVNLFLNKKLIFFHKYVCDICQNFPNRYEWLKTDVDDLENFKTPRDQLSIFTITQRTRSQNQWEPIFIGTNQDPLYDDRLTWEGRRDKMAQMYEMCLEDYYLLILGNAFLVHAPGIKHIDSNDIIRRRYHIKRNNAIYDATIAKLKNEYSTSSTVTKC